MRGAILHSPQYAFMMWCLLKHSGNFTFSLFTNSFYLHYVYSVNMIRVIKTRRIK